MLWCSECKYWLLCIVYTLGDLAEDRGCHDADTAGENARTRLSCAAGHADLALGKVDQLLPCRAPNNSVYVCLTRQLTKAKNPDYAEDFPKQALVKT